MLVTDNIHILKHEFFIPITQDKKMPRFVYSYIIFGEEICLIDSGVAGSHEKIFDYIKKQGREIKDITRMILSHAHPDHIGSAAIIKELTGCEVMAHQNEQKWFGNIELQNTERPVPGFFDLVNRSVVIDKFVEHEEEIELDKDMTLKIFHTPGHSGGSISIFIPGDKLLFTGDAIPLDGDLPNYQDYTTLLKSLSFIESLEGYEILISSWEDPQEKSLIKGMINRGKSYLEKIDAAVKTYYKEDKPDLSNCRNVIESLELPLAFVIPIVDQSFRSHLKNN
jgi:hydroxyacylglutathione hydrolase